MLNYFIKLKNEVSCEHVTRLHSFVFFVKLSRELFLNFCQLIKESTAINLSKKVYETIVANNFGGKMN